MTRVLELLERAIEGRLSIDEFHSNWPASDEGDRFSELLFEDLEDAIEHFPGSLLTGAPDLDLWHRSAPYFTLLLDRELLRKGHGPEAAAAVRSLADAVRFESEAHVVDFVRSATSGLK